MTGRQIEDKRMGMELGIEVPAGVMIEGRHQQSGGPFLDGAAPSAPRPGMIVFEVIEGCVDGLLVGGFDGAARVFGRESPQY